jgi:hypothetical protein
MCIKEIGLCSKYDGMVIIFGVESRMIIIFGAQSNLFYGRCEGGAYTTIKRA